MGLETNERTEFLWEDQCTWTSKRKIAIKATYFLPFKVSDLVHHFFSVIIKLCIGTTSIFTYLSVLTVVIVFVPVSMFRFVLF